MGVCPWEEKPGDTKIRGGQKQYSVENSFTKRFPSEPFFKGLDGSLNGTPIFNTYQSRIALIDSGIAILQIIVPTHFVLPKICFPDE